ncbi:aldehyde dehydrogenase family protein [Variovorax sp. J22R115]|uniref:aldehyde dehydrogenase family protein n=1 Tax=Variovorax sp. J22R115 TaxID=3053509 RepID=UPI002575232F|nr:aldehyde dehydrogenase family protein [Variovorax sp. J22R115]MDM0050005.1 aldehyde dehydrogenase family protein [Variovorax sp. J22R115]
MEVRSPFDGSLIATVAVAGDAEIERALSTAYALFRDRSAWLPPARRIEILRKAARLMEERAESLALEAAREGGKPLLDSRVEVARAIDGVQLCVDALRTEGGHVVPMDINSASARRVAFTHREPIGVVVAVSAFNHPLNLIVHQVGPAIAAGCPSIVKPAGDTPLSCLRFVEILHEAGLPQAWCQALVIDDTALATRLVADRRVGFLSFIGSARVGWMLRSKLAPGARCALEHGGVAPVLVAEDADLDAALPKLVKGGFYHAGQVCVSVQRVYAHRSICDNLARRLADEARKLKVGDPLSAETEVGPLIRPQEVERVHAWVREAVDGGATLLCGGKPISSSCYEPTVLLEPPPDSKVSTEEVFGPVICVYAYDELDEAIARANALPVAFQAAVFTRSLSTSMHAYARLDASAVMVNDHTAFRVDWMPFAGLRESGLGVGGIPHTFRDMQTEKLFVGPLP